MTYLGVIPARGGSKRIPKKNLKKIYGYPLIYWTIAASKNSKLMSDFYVSTDDSEIKEYSLSLGVKVIDRPKELSLDLTSSMDVLKHALILYPHDCVIMLQPTSPVRINGIIDQCISLFNEKKPDSLSTGFNSYQFQWGKIESMASQLMKPFFYNDGCVEIHKKGVILGGKSFGENRYELLVPQYYNHEIDSEIDFIEVEAVMKYLEEKNGNLF